MTNHLGFLGQDSNTLKNSFQDVGIEGQLTVTKAED
jgi:hypothetical protein